MAPFLVNHPALIDHWISIREQALARVRGLRSQARLPQLRQLVARAQRHVAGWQVEDAVQSARVAGLAADLDRLAAFLDAAPVLGARPWDSVFRWATAELALEAQEMLVSLLLEPHGDVVDDLAAQLACDEDADFTIDGRMTLGALARHIEHHYPDALQTDFTRPEAAARFWYVSAEKLEPRLGERFEEPGAEREQPLAVARDVAALHRAICARSAHESVAALLMYRPDLRHTVRRVQTAARHPYGEIRDNLVDAAVRPIDLLRCKLATFGATRFDPKSDRWVRISLFQGAPFPEELAFSDPDDWALPAAP
jgi:hypothetical protein